MQIIRLGETNSALTAVQFTSVLASDVQSRMTGALTIATKIKRAGVTEAATGAGTFTAVDDADAPGVREYIPASADLSLGVMCFVFTATLMEPREVPVMVVNEDPYKPAYYGVVIAGTLTTRTFSTNLTVTNADQFKDCYVEMLTGNNAGATRKIGAVSTGIGKIVTLATGAVLPSLPVDGDVFRIITS